MKTKNNQLIEDVYDYNVILFGMGINNSMNKGFSYDIALNFPEVKENENNTGYGDIRKYGTIHETKISDSLIFCACYCYNIGLKRNENSVFIDYDALESCLNLVYSRYKGKRIAAPIIGQDSYDGNGDKDRILGIFNIVFADKADITVYDFIQQDFKKERYKEAVIARKNYMDGVISKDEFKHIKKVNEWKRLNGIYKEMPNEFEYKPRRKNKNKIVLGQKKT